MFSFQVLPSETAWHDAGSWRMATIRAGLQKLSEPKYGTCVNAPRVRERSKRPSVTDFTSERKLPSPAERRARKPVGKANAKQAMSEHERDQKAFHNNFERLKAERRAREAASNSTDDDAGGASR
jgi:hypothetical protein